MSIEENIHRLRGKAMTSGHTGDDSFMYQQLRQDVELSTDLILREVKSLNKLLAAYREMRANDGGPGRVWDAGKHLAAEDLVRRLEADGYIIVAADGSLIPCETKAEVQAAIKKMERG